MSLSRILTHLRNSWRLLAICAVVGLALGGLVTMLQDKTYEAKAAVLVSPNVPLGTVGQDQGADASFIAQRAQSYAVIGASSEVLKRAAAAAGRDGLSSDAVKVEWAATAPAVLAISVTAPSARESAERANAVAAELIRVVDNLERPKNSGNATVRLSVSSAADPPTSPTSPNLVANLLVGLLAALAIGLAVVLAKVLFGRNVSDPAALTEATGEPPLAVIGTGGADHPLILRDAPQSPPAEAFRKLRTAVRFANPGNATQSLVVTAAQVGAGTTTVACNLALAMAEAGQQVVLVDANLRDPAVGELLRLQAGPGLAEVLAGEVELEAALQDGAPGCAVLTAGQGTPESGGGLAGPRMVALLERLEKQADLVVIDAPAVLPFSAAADLTAIADAALLVARFGKTKLEDLKQARAALAQVGTTVLGVAVNAAPGLDSKPSR